MKYSLRGMINSMNNSYFQMSWVMLKHMSVTYVDYISHFEMPVCFWQIKKLVVFWCALRLLVFELMAHKNYIQFCLKNEIKCARTFEMLTVAFGESTISRTRVQLRYNRFKEGQEDVNGEARPGHPSTSTTDENIEAMKKMILENRWITHVKFGQMWKFLLTVFFDCNDVVYHELLPQGYAKKFVRNAQNCGKPNHWFCTMIRHLLIECVSFWPKTKP